MSRATLFKLLGRKQRREPEKMDKFKSQARFANGTGRNRTNDFLMPSSAGNSVLARNGTGKWKSWTCEAIQRAAHALNPATKALSFLTDMVLDTVQVAAWLFSWHVWHCLAVASGQVACNPENPFHCNGTVMKKVVGPLGKVSLAACGFASAICGKSTKESPGFFC